MPDQPQSPKPGMRERKRRATRERIAEVATAQFMTRGFDAVTIADIAELADVSKVTVFNYFPRKEDIFFDRLPEAHAMLEAAVTNRPTDQTPFTAVRELLIDLAERGHPFAAAGEGEERWFRVVVDSPTLLAHAREAASELEDHLARLFEQAGGALATAEGSSPRGTAEARLAAAHGAAAYRTAYRETALRQLAREPSAALLKDHEARVSAAFARLARAIAPEAD